MNKLARSITAAAAALALPAAAPPPADVAIVGATVLPMEGRERLADQTVIVSGDRISAVGPRASVAVPKGTQVIDGRGKYVMPGLVDMHVHLAPAPGNAGDAAQRALAVMLAHGVTTARGMAGSPANLEVRGKVEAGEVAGPRIYAASPALHPKSAPSAEQGREAVRKAQTAGFDLIKSHALSDPAIWQAVADESRKLGIPTAGHVENSVGLDRAMAARQQIEHLDGVIGEVVKLVAPGTPLDWGQVPSPEALARASKVTDAQLAVLARKAVAARSWHVPTVALFEQISDTETPVEKLMADPNMRYVPDAALKQWAAQHDGLKKAGYSPADARAFVQLRRRIVAAFAKAGVPMMAGSDTAQAFAIWGPGLHAEMRALARAGLTPMQALRSATVVPRDYFRSRPNGGSALGWKADFGTVTRGARADLLLLDGDPLADLGALSRPAAVIAGGRLYDRAALDAMLAKAAADAKAPPPAK